MGNFKYFTKFLVYGVSKIYLNVEMSRQVSSVVYSVALITGMSWVRPPHGPNSFNIFMNTRFMDYVQEYNGKF